MNRQALSILASISVLLAWTQSRAQPEPDFSRASELYKAATAAVEQGRFDDAARDFGAAYDLTRDPALLFKLGAVSERAGKCDLAIGHFERYLNEGKPDAKYAELARARIIACGGTPSAAPPDPPPSPEPGIAAQPESEPDLPSLPMKPELARNFAGSVQLDYMAVPSTSTGRDAALDGATAEVSLKLAMDFKGKVSGNVKICVACHGFEVGMAYFDLRLADELNVRVGRFTPSFGEFPVRHDPANHRTSDKPLAYDMGRMLRFQNDGKEGWNEGVLPAPWVDNGLEINGTHFFGNHLQTDYAVYAIGGPRAGADPTDFDFKLSRSGESYYIDNNSRPVVGGQIVTSVVAGATTLALGASVMRGTYDPNHALPFSIYGFHAVLRMRDVFLRAEYLSRRTKMALGMDPEARFRYGPDADGMYDPYVVKDGAHVELEVPVAKWLTLVLREDGLRRRGNVVQSSSLRKDSAILRHTAGVALALRASLRLKLSYEYYDFSDFADASVIHAGIAGPF